MKTLILYSGKHGFTALASNHLKKQINGEVTLLPFKEANSNLLDSFDKVILGTSIYAGRSGKDGIKFIKNNENKLLEKKIGVFITGMREDGLDESIASFIPTSLNSKISVKGYFGFGVDFHKMNFFEKKIIKMVGKLNKTTIEIKDQKIQDFATSINSL